MTGCDVNNGDGCKMIQDHDKELYDKEFGLVNIVKDKIGIASVRSYFIAFGGLIIIGAFTVWANTNELKKDVPECKATLVEVVKDVGTLKTDTAVLQTEKQQLQDDVKEIKRNVNRILEILDKSKSISLTSGDNEITITAYDNSENDKTDTITITYTPSPITKSGVGGSGVRFQ